MTERDSSQPGGRVRGGSMSDAAVDEALAAWPMAERDAMEWDEAAARVEERIDAGASAGDISAALSDDALFAAPLDAERDEPGARDSVPPEEPVSISARSVRPRRSFKDLADLAKSTTPPPVLVEAGVGVEAGVAAAAAIEVEGRSRRPLSLRRSRRRSRKRRPRSSFPSARRRRSRREKRSRAAR